ncbi:MAG: SDR family oxidoreductase [Burkholderiales bacterium]|nr:MAG: SDR family oxidoreductase [Burkholderiales bacterium]
MTDRDRSQPGPGAAAADATPAVGDAGRGRLHGAVALITGASRGIGRAIAQAYAAEGADLCLVATSAARLDELAAALPRPVRTLRVAADVADRDACLRAVERAEAEFGRVDILVNNAGIYLAKPFVDHSPQDFRQLLEVNLFGVIHLTQAVLPGMLERGYGRIVNIASTAGKWASRNQSGYNISNHAVVGLTRCVAWETAARGVTVNAICPGFVQTDLIDGLKADYRAMGLGDPDAAFDAIVQSRVPLGRVLRADEITGLAVLLAAPESSGITGQSILVDGGMLVS